MEIVEDIVIVGAGIAGLTTSLALLRLGIRSLVLESSEALRVTGFAITTWYNGWKALDAIGIGDSLRQQHCTFSPRGGKEARCLRRKVLVETLAKELPNDTIRYSSKVVSIEESGFFKLVHLSDGTIIKTKVVIGCDGVKSVVAKFLGLKKPVLSERCTVRGLAEFKDTKGLEFEYLWFVRNGVRSAFIPCDDKAVYWSINWLPSSEEKLKMAGEKIPTLVLKQLALKQLDHTIMADHGMVIESIMENTGLDRCALSRIKYRRPWDIAWGDISKGNVCVVGDALHPSLPYLGQGGGTAMEDGLVLARCLAQAMNKTNDIMAVSSTNDEKDGILGREYSCVYWDEFCYKKVESALKKYSEERRWRIVEVVVVALVTGYVQNHTGPLITFLRDNFLNKFWSKIVPNVSDFDCGRLSISRA